jgi:hypothetical protein
MIQFDLSPNFYGKMMETMDNNGCKGNQCLLFEG